MTGRAKVRAVVIVLLGLVALLAEGSAVAGAAPRRGAPEGTTDWVQISSGFYHTCGVRNTGRLYCWGEGNRGPLGNGGTGNASVPTEVAGGATDWKSVSAGSKWTCAIKTNGTLWCWGRDDFGQLGNGPGGGDVLTPTQVGTATDWKSVSAGLGETTCGRRATKRIYCWGRDNNGQVGNGPGSSTNVESPTAVGTNADWTSVSTGGYHVCGRRSNGRIYCWGDDLDGAVGDGGTGIDRPSPTQIAGGFADWTAVSAGLTHTCARRGNGRLYCFGSDINGGIGDGGATNTNRYAPVEVKGNRTDWAAVFAGGYATCARRNSGQLFCWGYDFYGQNGTGATPANPFQHAAPVQVAGAATDWKTATIGNLHVCARKATSRIYCWGYGFFGQRGDGQSGPGANVQPTPTEVS